MGLNIDNTMGDWDRKYFNREADIPASELDPEQRRSKWQTPSARSRRPSQSGSCGMNRPPCHEPGGAFFWRCVNPGGTEYGGVDCRDLFICSFRKQFTLLSADPGDLAVFQFDLKDKCVFLAVGGPGLFEAVQDPDGNAPHKEMEDVSGWGGTKPMKPG
jgi:hypothetical protein